MNISKEQVGDLNLTVSVDINKDDYEPKVNEVLRDYRRKVSLPGFRPGKAPEGLIRKMYGKSVLVDEINKLVAGSLQNYIKDEQLSLLGDPMPVNSGIELEWEIGNPFCFSFEMGLAPIVEVGLSKDDKVVRYRITVDKEMVDKDIDSYAARYGQFVNVESVTDFKEKLTGDIVRLGADSQALEDEFSAEDTSILLSLVKDDEHKKVFENAKVGDEIIFNLSETFPNDWEIASILKKKDKEEISDIAGSLFRFTVKTIEKFVYAELNQELFDKVFGEGEVTGLEDFEERIKSAITERFEASCMIKFGSDMREYLLEKVNPQLPEEFLRKWLLSLNKDVDPETFEKEFPAFLKSMKQDLITQSIIKQKEVKVEEQEVIDAAKETTKRQFAQYGLTNIPDSALMNYAMGALREEKNVRQYAAQVMDKKVTEVVYDEIDVEVKDVSLDEFNKLFYSETANEENTYTDNSVSE
jgi:trigger factor